MKLNKNPFPFLIFLVLTFILNLSVGISFARSQNQHKLRKVKKNVIQKDAPIDQLLDRIDAAHLMLNQYDDKANTGFTYEEINAKLPRLEDGLNLVESVLSKKNKWIDVNNLQTYSELLTSIENELKNWRDDLLESNKELVEMNTDLKEFIQTRDSVLNKMQIDSSYKTLINQEIKDLSDKYVENQQAVSQSIVNVNRLQARLSNLYYKTVELEDGIYDLSKNYWYTVTHPEAPYLWQKSINKPINKSEFENFSGFSETYSQHSQQIILLNYFDHNRIAYILLSIFALFFFFWVFLNYRRASKSDVKLGEGILSINYLESIPTIPTLILVLNIIPFLDLNTPSIFFEFLQTILILLLTITIFRHWPRKYFIYWIGFLILYILFSWFGQNHTLNPRDIITTICLNLISIVLGVLFLRISFKDQIISNFEKFATFIFILGNFVALVLNLTSYLSLAEQISYASIFGISQALTLTAGFRIFSEGLFLQAIITRNSESSGFVFEDEKIRKNLNTVFLLIIVIFWLISFSDNLNLFDPIEEGIESFLGVPRHIGNTTFAYGNVILFFLIISIANFIQKFLGFFFGENYSGDDQSFKKKTSRLAITRLLLLLGGFLIAVLASGLPVDRITILLGALGVGIGLGLQSIVNNLVSGIILIFERPFRIGDLIEVGTRKGRVKEIGLRSSKLFTSEGSEVIIPNGDMLSERVVNWTLNNDYARLEFEFKIPNESNLELVKTLIIKLLENNTLVLHSIPAEILISDISDTVTTLKVGIWINNINREKFFRSDFLSKAYPSFVENNIVLKA